MPNNKKLLGITVTVIALLFLLSSVTGCDNAEFTFVPEEEEKISHCTVQGNKIICPDGSELDFVDTDTDTTCTVVNNTITCPDGTNITIEDQIEITKTELNLNGCQAISHGLFVEVIRNGEIFDVYTDSSCSDRKNGILNEVCDNVQPSFGNSGQLGFNKPGSSTVCPYENKLIYGHILDNILTISVLEIF